MRSIGALWRWFWSKENLLSGWLLNTLIIGVGLGTIYGYYWYWGQLVYIYETQPAWLLLFVPDSPTASLFFTFAIIYLETDRRRNRLAPFQDKAGPVGFVRGFVEAFTVVTMVKYGIWAVVIIYWAYFLGEPWQWEHGMLTASHLAMALAASVYGRFFRYRWVHLAWVALWTFTNDLIDYGFNVFPSLSRHLHPYLDHVRTYTISMSVISVSLAALYILLRRKKVPHRK